MDPDRELKILVAGFAEAKMAAFRTNQIDIAVGDAPDADLAEIEGIGHLYLDCATDITIFREYPYTVLLVTPEFADQQQELTRRVAQSIGAANDLFYSDFAKAMDALRAQLPNLNQKALERAVEREKNEYPRGGRMTEQMWKNVIKVAQDLKMISKPIPSEEGHIWTNKFLA